MLYKDYAPANRWLALIMGLTLLILFGGIMAIMLGQHGVKMIAHDSFIYLRTGLHVAWGDGLGLYRYYPDIDSRQFVYTSHYPPITSLTYGLLARIPTIPASAVPAIVSLIGWVALLAAIGLYTLQLGKSPLIAALIIVVPATSYNVRLIFQHILSETIFLPLLVWLMVITYQLPQRQQGQRIRLVGVAVLVMLLILTRYVGVVVLAAVMLWWAWHWWYTPHRKLATLVGDSAILASAALPLIAMMIYQTFQPTRALGNHMSQSDYTFQDGVWAMVFYSRQLVLPNTHIGTNIEPTVWYGWLIHLGLWLMLGGVLWYVAKRGVAWRQPHSTPALLFLGGYVLLYTLVQPFFSFTPIDWRDMTTMICLAIPLIGGAIAQLPLRWSYGAMIVFIGLNSLFPVMIEHGFLSPPRPSHTNTIPVATDIGNNQHNRSATELSGLYQDLIQDQDELFRWVQAQPKESVFLTNAPDLLAPYARGAIEDIVEPYFFDTPRKLVAWLDAGSCTSRYPVYVVVFPLDKFSRDAQAIQARIERKCPHLVKQQLSYSTLYPLVHVED